MSSSTLVTIATVLTAIAGSVLDRHRSNAKTATKLEEIHVLVNSRLTAVLEVAEKLSAQLVAAGLVPEAAVGDDRQPPP